MALAHLKVHYTRLELHGWAGLVWLLTIKVSYHKHPTYEFRNILTINNIAGFL